MSSADSVYRSGLTPLLGLGLRVSAINGDTRLTLIIWGE